MKSLADLEAIRKKTLEQVTLRKDEDSVRIVVGMATCGIAAGARPVLLALLAEVEKNGLSNDVISVCFDEKTGAVSSITDKAGNVYVVHAGESISFPPNEGRGLKNESGKPAKMLVIINYPEA